MEKPLARLRFDESETRGRRYPEIEHSYRGPFERDRARIIHSRAFRRLEGKTQVFAPRRGDHFRNRLTHTLEVAQIARSVADHLGLNADYAEALALVHDVGHPPFGHAGEAVLHAQMQKYGEVFDHNLHALQLVEHFEHRYLRHAGLNLTYEVREGIVKHSRDWTEKCPVCVLDYEPRKLPLLEAQIIDLADEIAYNTADLEDAYQAGLIGRSELAEALPWVGELLEQLESQYPAAEDWLIFQEAIRTLVSHLAGGLLEGTVAACEQARVERSTDVRDLPNRVALYASDAWTTTGALKRLLRAKVYHSEELQAGRRESTERMHRVFDHLIAHPDSLPDAYRLERNTRPLWHVVRDYVAGMTDSYFLHVYEQLFESPAA